MTALFPKYLRIVLVITMVDISAIHVAMAQSNYRGNLSSNPYNSNSTSNPYGNYGSIYSPSSINNPYGAGNPYSTTDLKLYDSQGNYRGKLNDNRYDPESVSNPYGKYGSKYSSESINNPYGAGSPYNSESPNNPYGKGLRIIEVDPYDN